MPNIWRKKKPKLFNSASAAVDSWNKRRASLNTRRVDMNNAAFKRPTTADAIALRERLRRSLAAALTDHRLETTSSARWLVRCWCVAIEFDRLILRRDFFKGGPDNGTLSALTESEGHRGTDDVAQFQKEVQNDLLTRPLLYHLLSISELKEERS